MADDELDDYVWERLTSSADADWSEAWLSRMPPIVRACVATSAFEFTVGNGGLTQLFLNWEDEPWLVQATIEGYKLLGLGDVSETIVTLVLPVAESDGERRVRQTMRREPFSRTAEHSLLNALSDLIEDHRYERVRLIRANPTLFGFHNPSASPT
jgi:hypothetical protein